MRQIKKTLSIFMATLFVMAGILGNIATKAATVTVPAITYVGVSHSPLVEGDTEKFTVTSNYTGDVQYKAFLYSEKTNKWVALSADYSAAVNAQTPYEFKETGAFGLGKHKLSVWVKKAGTAGIKSNANGGFDSYYVAELNCVTKDAAKRVYANGAAKFETAGLTFKFNGIEGIGGITGPYLYRLHIYNPTTNVWTKRVSEYKDITKEALEYKFDKAGTYMVVVHANTAKSTTWANYTKEVKTTANQGSTYGTYEAWKTIMVTVKDGVKVFDTTVATATFGSLVNVKMTAEGTKEFPTATQYQIFNGTSAISSPSALGTATTVFPAKVTGDKVNVKLLNAAGVEVKTIEVLLGQSGTITIVPPVVSLVSATVKVATFGSLVDVTTNQVSAVKYQVFNGTAAISSPTALGTATTVFPGKVAGDKVNVKLINAADAVISITEVVLVAAK